MRRTTTRPHNGGVVSLANKLVDALETDADQFSDVSQGEALVAESLSDGCGEFAGAFVGIVGLLSALADSDDIVVVDRSERDRDLVFINVERD